MICKDCNLGKKISIVGKGIIEPPYVSVIRCPFDKEYFKEWNTECEHPKGRESANVDETVPTIEETIAYLKKEKRKHTLPYQVFYSIAIDVLTITHVRTCESCLWFEESYCKYYRENIGDVSADVMQVRADEYCSKHQFSWVFGNGEEK